MSKYKEPAYSMNVVKWNVVGRNNLLKQDMWLNGKDKVKILIGKRFLSILKINNKKPNKNNSDVYDRVKQTLRFFYDDIIINYHR